MSYAIDIIPKVRAIARRLGWAIGVHGTLARDIDLIGVPWTTEAAQPYVVLCEIRRELNLELGNVVNKPHGRMGCILHEKDAVRNGENFTPPQLDLSLIGWEP